MAVIGGGGGGDVVLPEGKSAAIDGNKNVVGGDPTAVVATAPSNGKGFPYGSGKR